jgi:TonB family protein
VKLDPPKPQKQKPPDRPVETPPASAAALPYAPAGSTGLQGQISLDARDFEFTYYLLLVRNRIAQNWTPPTGLAGGNPVQTVIQFRIGRGGELAGVRVETGSGIEFFDRSALRAVMLSDPLPPLPLGYSGSDLGVHFGFRYAAP